MPQDPTQRDLTAAELQGARNRLTLSPELVRRVAVLGGYDAHDAFSDKLTDVVDVTDLIELLVTAQLGETEPGRTAARQVESERARRILERIATGQTLTRQGVHDNLPSETVVLFRMGPPRLWGYAVRQRTPRNAGNALPARVPADPTGTWASPEEAWLGWHITDASDLDELATVVPGVLHDNDLNRRLRLGMSLSDGPDQVWSSARGHWSIKPETTYIVPSRYGWCPYVFRIPDGGWRGDEFEGHRTRYMAERGYWIDVDNGRLVEMGEPDPDNSWLPRMSVSDEAPTETDMAVAGLLTDRVLRLGAAGKNPVIRLRQRGRRLF